MIWDDIGYLLSKNRYNENSLIVEIFTQKHGKVSGIIFGGTSKKIKNYLQIGNKLSCIISAMSLVKLLTADSQQNKSIYSLLENFFTFIKNDNWIKNYIYWELKLFTVLGYDIEFNNLVDKKMINNKMQYISKSSTEKKIIPDFLVDKNQNTEDLKTLLGGLKLVGDYLEKTILRPNNLIQPISRFLFINSLK